MTLWGRFITNLTGLVFSAICRIDDSELDKLPDSGPYIIAINHVNFLDAPMLYLRCRPRQVRGFAKIETWNTPVVGYLARIWRGIPVRRGMVDRQAISSCVDALKSGDIIGMAPEGTRSKDGVLRKGYPGIVLIAGEADVPIYPVAHYGDVDFWKNLKRLRRTPFNYRVGSPVRIKQESIADKQVKRIDIASEIMVELARLLPEEYRGPYADKLQKTPVHIKVEPR